MTIQNNCIYVTSRGCDLFLLLGVVIQRLSDDVNADIGIGGSNFKFEGQGQRTTALITYKGVLKLIMALPGINAREMRTKFADVLQKYFAGDASLVLEMMDNAESTAGINSLARETLDNPGVYLNDQKRKRIEEDPEELKLRLKKMQLDMDMDFAERMLKLQTDMTDIKNKKLQDLGERYTTYVRLFNDGVADDKTKLLFKDAWWRLELQVPPVPYMTPNTM